MLLAAYVQDLNPLGNRILSTIVAALPVLVLFYLLIGRRDRKSTRLNSSH